MHGLIFCIIALVSLLHIEAQAQVLYPGSIQPGIFPPPSLPRNFSVEESFWPHDTPLLHLPDNNSPADERPLVTPREVTYGKYWRGWGEVKHVFSFGDSYMSTGFNATGEQPNLNNPLGNPPYPGATSSNGPNIVDFLTTTYNRSEIFAYDLAYGGAMIDNAIVPSPFGLLVKSFADQVRTQFKPLYANESGVSWVKEDTLFVIFIGINDAINTYNLNNSDALQYAQVKRYEELVNELYECGARNFYFLHIPPIDRAPYMIPASTSERKALADWIGAYIFRLHSLIWNFNQRNSEATTFELDTNSLFLNVIANASQFNETACYKITDDFCDKYEHGTPDLYSFDPSCQIPVNQYLWLNSLHPTFPMHNLIASQLQKQLMT